jgi:hypothetical protein
MSSKKDDVQNYQDKDTQARIEKQEREKREQEEKENKEREKRSILRYISRN